jgi:hypothetical protein
MVRACLRGPLRHKHNKKLLKSVLSLFIFLIPCVVYAVDFDLEKAFQRDLEHSCALVETISGKIASGKNPAAETAQLINLSEKIQAAHLLMLERFRLREETAKKLGQKAVDRNKTVSEGYRKALEEYLNLVNTLASDKEVPKSTIDRVRSFLKATLHANNHPITGSLPYKHLNYPAREPSASPAVTPAYEGGNQSTTGADLAGALEAPLTKEIAELALSLDWSPVRIYEYIKNNVDTEREKEFMQLSALQGSALEHTLFEDAFGVSSVSTAKVLGVANGAEPLVPVLTIDQTDIASILPTLPVDQNIKDDIADSVYSQNFVVRIPQSEEAYLDWTGTGYLKENTSTGEAGYMLSGMVAGGMTAASPSKWPARTFSVVSKPYQDSDKELMILTPGNEATITYSPVDVTGIVLDSASTVTVNNVTAEVNNPPFRIWRKPEVPEAH